MAISLTSHPRPPAIKGHIRPLGAIAELETQWRALEATADCSFFLSWGWIGTWAAQAQPHCNLHRYEAYADDELIALALIDIGSTSRRLVLHARTVTLNEAVDPTRNMFIEYNGIVVKRGYEAPAWQQFIRDIAARLPEWDELRLTNIPEHLIDDALAQRQYLHTVVDASSSAWIAALTETSDLDSIIDNLGPRRRWQLRRSLKEYEREGPLAIDAAQNLEQALDYFSEMGRLHSARWQKAGKRGAYAKASWVEFHTNLIRNTFALNQIQLLRIRCGNRNIGFIYNFLWRSTALVLQTGFALENRNVLRPGYISHMLAMQFNAKLGITRYDFMIGDSDYKRVLGQAGPPQVTVRLQRNRLKLTMERLLQAVVKKLR